MNSNSKRFQGADNFLGHKGPIALRRLKYFDVCQGFLVDSLHALYGGCFVSPEIFFLSVFQYSLCILETIS